jgi:hypothetical protein
MVGMKSSGTSPSDHQKTQVLYGVENIIGFTLKRFSLIKEKSIHVLIERGHLYLLQLKLSGIHANYSRRGVSNIGLSQKLLRTI